MSMNRSTYKIIALIAFAFASVMLLCPLDAFCVAPSERWNRTFGGPEYDSASSVQETEDGGYIIAGLKDSSTGGVMNFDAWLIKTGSDGNEFWNKTFGGKFTDRANSVQEDKDGGYIIAGETDSFGAGYPAPAAWLIRMDSDGDELWNKTFGRSGYNSAYSVRETKDGGYIIAGSTDPLGAGLPDAWLIKTDSDGNELWNKTFGGSNFDSASSVQVTEDGGYVIVGKTRSFEGPFFLPLDAWLIRTDSAGEELWNKTFGGPFEDVALSVQETEYGNYIIAGYTESFGAGRYDAWLIRTDSLGSELWNKTFGGSQDDFASSVQKTVDGGYIITGITGSFGPGGLDVWLIKTDSEGDKQWSKTFGGSDGDEGNSVQETEDGGYIIAGDTYSFSAHYDADAWLIKVCPEEVYPKELCSGKACQDYEPKRGRCCSESEYPEHSIVY